MPLSSEHDEFEIAQQLREVKNLDQLSKLLAVTDVDGDELMRLILTPGFRNYRTWHLAKKGGGERKIYSPSGKLKEVQRSIKRLLDDLYVPSDLVHGFLVGRNIVTNATPHVGQRWVFNIDIKDYFPTIRAHRVDGLFRKPPYGLHPDIAEALTRLCTYQGLLPAGAPTSPVIANMICRTMDRSLHELAQKNGCNYSRYADDLTFSTSRSSFPLQIAVRDGETWGVGPTLSRIVSRSGFEINSKKVRMQERSVQQSATGVVVNQRVNVDRRYIRNIRGAIHAIEKHGLGLAQQEFRKRRGSDAVTPDLRSVIWGKIAFVSMVRGKNDPVVANLRTQLRRAIGSIDSPTIESLDDDA